MYESIERLKQQALLWQGNRPQAAGVVQSSGFPELDQHLDGGWPAQGVITLQTPVGIGELRLWIPALLSAHANQHTQTERMIVFIAPPAQLNAEFLVAEQLPLNRILLIQTDTSKKALWAAEQCLKSGACQDVLLWHEHTLDMAQARRLQVASQTGQCRNILIRQHAQGFALPVTLAMQLAPAATGLSITINKRKGGWSAAPFTLDMHQRWPSLVLSNQTNQVIPFPRQRLG